jgi:DNA polymerase family A
VTRLLQIDATEHDGGLRAAVPFRAVWCLDFEFNGAPGERPRPVCMVARELFTGETIRLWRDDLLLLQGAPFDIGPHSLVVAYAAQAELACFLALGWPLPANVLDLFAEHRVATNGLALPCGNGLLGALACRGLAHIDAGEKEHMRRLIMERQSWTEQAKRDILDYCQSDVDGLVALMREMAPVIDWPRALLRGRYTKAVAHQQYAGVPIDAKLHRRLANNWDPLKQRLVRDVDAQFDVYDGTTFKINRFADWLLANGIPWPRLASGTLALDDDTFKQQALRFPSLQPLRELRSTLGKLRLTGLAVGTDGRNRYPIWPYSSKTGRNQPSNAESIFGPAKWMRGLIRPPEGWGVAYLDFAAQEIGIAAALSGDERMTTAYASGDPYLSFAKLSGLAPADATAASHPIERERAKRVMLAVNYGMGERSLAERLGVAPIEARELLRSHQTTFPRFYRWIDGVVSRAMLTNEITSRFGWKLRVGRDPNPRSVMNFPMQANGAEMMRVAAIAATEASIEVCAPVHDAFLIAAPLERLDEDVERMRAIMTRAGSVVTRGLDIRTEAKVVRWPDRYMTDGAQDMWGRVMRLLEQVEADQ